MNVGIEYKDPANIIIPIQEPFKDIPSYELGYPELQRAWIRERDNGECQMPIIDENGLFVSYAGDTTPLQVHHITPEYYYKNFQPTKYAEKNHHNPLNGITIGSYSHSHIHRDWITMYKHEYDLIPARGKRGISLEAYVNLQTAQGRPAWLTSYDKYFHLIATLNTYDHMIESPTFPFPEEYKGIVEQWYDKAIRTYPEFVESYYANRGW